MFRNEALSSCKETVHNLAWVWCPLTLDNILDFENSYHIYFVEELFPFPPSHPTTFITHLLQLFPLQYHNPPFYPAYNAIYTSLIHRVQQTPSLLQGHCTPTTFPPVLPTWIPRNLRTSNNKLPIPSSNYWEVDYLFERHNSRNPRIYWRKSDSWITTTWHITAHSPQKDSICCCILRKNTN